VSRASTMSHLASRTDSHVSNAEAPHYKGLAMRWPSNGGIYETTQAITAQHSTDPEEERTYPPQAIS